MSDTSDTPSALRSTLAELVAVDTTSSRSNAPLVELARGKLEAVGFQTELLAYRDEAGVEKVNLLAMLGGPLDVPAELALVGHTDCVPYDPAWTDALRLTEKDGRLYGRGACDTKGFIACALHAVTHLSRPPRAPLLVLLTADEELGCEGAKHLVTLGRGRARHAIVGEPTRLVPVRAHKGYCLAEVEVGGREGHSAYPDEGASAIFRAGRFLQKLETLARTRLREDRDESFAPPFTTVNVGRIGGGKASNIIPGACRFIVEWRPIPRQPREHVLELLESIRRELVADEPGYEARIRLIRAEPAVDTRADAEVVRLLSRLSGHAPITVPFGTEAPQLTELGAEAVVFGPGDIRVAHQTGEYVPVEDLVRCESALSQAITHFCGDGTARVRG